MVIILTVSRVIKVRKWGCSPLTHYFGGDFDHDKIMRPVFFGRGYGRFERGFRGFAHQPKMRFN